MMRLQNALSLALVASLLPASPVIAQVSAPPSASGQPEAEAAIAQSDIVVEAPLIVPVPSENQPSEAVSSALASVRIYVLYHDLDLSRPEGARRLMERIDDTARQACGYLDKLHPLDDDAGCIARAAASAEPAAKAAIAKATGAGE
jgi:UrcA family protein